MTTTLIVSFIFFISIYPRLCIYTYTILHYFGIISIFFFFFLHFCFCFFVSLFFFFSTFPSCSFLIYLIFLLSFSLSLSLFSSTWYRPTCLYLKSKNPSSGVATVILNGWKLSSKRIVKFWFLLYQAKLFSNR